MGKKKAPKRKPPKRAKKTKRPGKKKGAKRVARGVAKKVAKKVVRKAAVKRRAKVASVDFRKERPEHFRASAEPELADIRPAKYLTVEGVGAPGGEAFQAAVGLLYGVAYTLKFELRETGRDFRVPSLESLWWTEPAGRPPSPRLPGAAVRSSAEEGRDFASTPREEWRWKLLSMVRDEVTEADVRVVVEKLVRKKRDEAFRRVSLETVAEGRCVQMLHVGPYSDEPASVARMLGFMEERGLRPRGYHHEIYLSDPKRTLPEKLKTILRQPVA